MEDDKAFQLILGAISRVEEKVDSIDDKLDTKVASLHAEIARIDIRCAGNQVCNTGVSERVKAVELAVKDLQVSSDRFASDIKDIRNADVNNEWKVFFRMTAKLAVFVLLIGSVVLFLYQVFEKFRNPAAPLPEMPNLP